MFYSNGFKLFLFFPVVNEFYIEEFLGFYSLQMVANVYVKVYNIDCHRYKLMKITFFVYFLIRQIVLVDDIIIITHSLKR